MNVGVVNINSTELIISVGVAAIFSFHIFSFFFFISYSKRCVVPRIQPSIRKTSIEIQYVRYQRKTGIHIEKRFRKYLCNRKKDWNGRFSHVFIAFFLYFFNPFPKSIGLFIGIKFSLYFVFIISLWYDFMLNHLNIILNLRKCMNDDVCFAKRYLCFDFEIATTIHGSHSLPFIWKNFWFLLSITSNLHQQSILLALVVYIRFKVNWKQRKKKKN